jgi:WD40 repeat protein
VYSAAFSPDGSHIIVASVSGLALIWDAATTKKIAVLRSYQRKLHSAVFSPDGSRIVTAADNKTARIFNNILDEGITSDGTPVLRRDAIAVLRGHDDSVNSAAFSPDGSRIVTASDDHTARIWNVATAKEIAILRGHDDSVNSAAFSPDGSRIVTASDDHTARIWDAATAKEIAVLRGHEDDVNSAAFSPDGSSVVTASDDQTASIWDVHLQTTSAKNLLVQACGRLAGLSRLTYARDRRVPRGRDCRSTTGLVSLVLLFFIPDLEGSDSVAGSLDAETKVQLYGCALLPEARTAAGRRTPRRSIVTVQLQRRF